MKQSNERAFWVVVKGVNHLVKNGYIVCDKTLNKQKWNVTKKKTICPECAEHVELIQFKLFELPD